ncbi:hypothetical protein ALTERO38_50008 [Alteromonas sp. 38]|nr:hypothetical protein ALTER154_90224 [Alteromonas sp. 154]VXB16303.1 hypothetical protein ALTERO38_50008 [Alteromonas sp. 38]
MVRPECIIGLYAYSEWLDCFTTIPANAEGDDNDIHRQESIRQSVR